MANEDDHAECVGERDHDRDGDRDHHDEDGGKKSAIVAKSAAQDENFFPARQVTSSDDLLFFATRSTFFEWLLNGTNLKKVLTS